MLPLLDGPEKPDWSKHCQATYRALVSNTHWPQARQARHDPQRQPLCQLCKSEAGTMWHRRFSCSASQCKRLECTSTELRKAAAQALAVSEEAGEMFARGIFPDLSPLAPDLLTSSEATVLWWNKPASGYLTGSLFTDGSGHFPQWTCLRRAGWAVVQTDGLGFPVAAAYGAVPVDLCPFQVARDGEDFAISMLAVVARPPFCCHIDCQGTLDCLHGGAAVATAASNPRAHLWRSYFQTFQDGDITARKTKVHATAGDVEAGRTTWFEKRGNDAADRFAKRGAAAHLSAAEAFRVTRACALVVREAVQWAVKQEQWLSEQGLVDSQSIVEPPLLTRNTQDCCGSFEEQASSATAANECFFKGHRLVVFWTNLAKRPLWVACVVGHMPQLEHAG